MCLADTCIAGTPDCLEHTWISVFELLTKNHRCITRLVGETGTIIH